MTLSCLEALNEIRLVHYNGTNDTAGKPKGVTYKFISGDWESISECYRSILEKLTNPPTSSISSGKTRDSLVTDTAATSTQDDSNRESTSVSISEDKRSKSSKDKKNRNKDNGDIVKPVPPVTVETESKSKFISKRKKEKSEEALEISP